MTLGTFASFGAVLKGFRTRRELTQQTLAEKLGVRRNTIGSWERGDFLPQSKGVVLELAKHLHLDDEEIHQLLEASLTLAPHWLVPSQRNPYFTGREEILEVMHTQLGFDQAVAPTQFSALHGLGGVGKTQIALEYAYLYGLEYSAVFWIAAETDEQVIASLLHMAETLRLPEQEEKDQQRAVAAVQRWLSTHGQWLLIWDNVEDLDVLHRFLPSARSGAILITTRCQTLGTLAHGLDLSPMEQEEGMLFLLLRAKLLGSEATCQDVRRMAENRPIEYAAAWELVTVLGGLPLALDQAGAYLEATRCGLAAYLELFRARRAILLQLRGEGARDHPASVSATFTLALRVTAERHPAVEDLLYICALLQPDAIPEELFRQGGEYLGAQLQAVCCDPLEWDWIVGVACSSSLLSRQAEEQTLSIHRLVQAVLLDGMSEAEHEQWSTHVIEALDAVFPTLSTVTEHTLRKQCERVLPHALHSLRQVGSREGSLAFASLAYKTAYALHARARYAEAESLHLQALHIREQILGPTHPEVASALNNLAIVYWMQGRYTQAEPFYLRALQIREQVQGPDHPYLVGPLCNLAGLYQEQGKYAEAEALYLRALHLGEQALGPAHPQVAALLSNLSGLYREQRRYAEAEPPLLRALQIWEQARGPNHPDVTYPLDGLAELYGAQGKYVQAEPLCLRALQIWEQAHGPDHPAAALWLTTLANLSVEQGKYAEAEPLLQRALAIREQHLGKDHPETAHTLHDLAILRQKQSNVSEAISLAKRALAIRSQSLGEAHPQTVITHMLYEQLVQEQADGAEPTLEHLRIFLKARGWSMHLKKQRSKFYVYATRKVGGHTQSRYLAPLSNLPACLAAARVLPNAREQGKVNGCLTESD